MTPSPLSYRNVGRNKCRYMRGCGGGGFYREKLTCLLNPYFSTSTLFREIIMATQPLPYWRLKRAEKLMGTPGFCFGGGGIEHSGRTPPSPQKGSIDKTPKILPSLTPGPWR